MPGLDELRKRVEAAEQQFGLITTQSRKYSERLTHLVAQMELSHSDQHKEIAALNAQLGQYEQENGALKSMLMSLLQAIEDGDGSLIGCTVRDMESRIGRLIGVGGDGAAAEPAAADLIDEPAATALADEPDAMDVASEPAGDDTLEIEAVADDAAEEDASEEDEVDFAVAETGDAPDIDADEAPAAAVECDDAAAEAEAVSDATFEVADADIAEDDSVIELDEPTTGEDDELIEEVTSMDAPVPETIELDDEPVEEDELAASAHNLLDRVEAAANALLAAGADSETDDVENELTDEISALLQSAVNGALEPEAEAAKGDDEALAVMDDDDMAALMAAGEDPSDDLEDDKASRDAA